MTNSKHLVGRFAPIRGVPEILDVPCSGGGEDTLIREDPVRPLILRLRDLPATPGNLKRIREKVRLLNARLEDAGTPFRLRVV